MLQLNKGISEQYLICRLCQYSFANAHMKSPGYPLKPASANKHKIQSDAWISAFFAYFYLQHFQRLCHVGWWAGDLMPCSVWCLYKKCSIVSTGYSFWWELAGIICANDSLSILQDEEHVFPVESRDTALSSILWTGEYGTVHQATCKTRRNRDWSMMGKRWRGERDENRRFWNWVRQNYLCGSAGLNPKIVIVSLIMKNLKTFKKS